MNKYIYLLIGCVSVLVCSMWYRFSGGSSVSHASLKQQAHDYYVDFDASMQTEQYATLLNDRPDYNRLLTHFKTLYDRCSFKHITVHEVPKIPQIIHHIWLGSP